MTIPNPRLTASHPLHIEAVHPNIKLIERAIKTDDLQGLYLDFAAAAISGFFTQVIMHHDASLRPSRIETIPSDARWEPRRNKVQAESAIRAISGQSLPVGGETNDVLRAAIMKKIGPVCFVPAYEK